MISTGSFRPVREDLLEFTYTANYEGTVRYTDGIKKDNPCIRGSALRLHYINTARELQAFQNDLLCFSMITGL